MLVGSRNPSQCKSKKTDPLGRDGKRLQNSCTTWGRGSLRSGPPTGGFEKEFSPQSLKRRPTVNVFLELVSGRDNLAANLDDDGDRSLLPTYEQKSADCDSPSELHVFESLETSSGTVRITPDEESPAVSFFDEMEKSIAVNSIATHFSGLPSPPVPQKIGIYDDGNLTAAPQGDSPLQAPEKACNYTSHYDQ